MWPNCLLDNILVFTFWYWLIFRYDSHKMWMTQVSQKQKHSLCACLATETQNKHVRHIHTHRNIRRVKQTHGMFFLLSFTLTDRLTVSPLHWLIIRANNTVPYVITAIIMSPGLHYRLRLWAWSSPRGEFKLTGVWRAELHSQASEMKSWCWAACLSRRPHARVTRRALEECRVTVDWC